MKIKLTACLIIVAVFSNVCERSATSQDVSNTQIQQTLIPFSTDGDEFWLVLRPETASQTVLWSLADSQSKKRVESLLPADAKRIKTISILTSFSNVQQFFDSVAANSLSTVIPVAEDLLNPLSGSTLEEVQRVTRHSVLQNSDFAAFVEFHGPTTIEEMGQWLVTAPDWFQDFHGGPNENRPRVQDWNGQSILVVDDNTAAIWQIDPHRFIVTSLSRMKNGLDSSSETSSSSEWFEKVASPGDHFDLSVTFRMAHFTQFQSDRKSDFGSFEIIKQADSCQLELGFADAGLARLSVYFDSPELAKQFTRKTELGHQLLEMMLVKNLDGMREKGFGQKEHWLAKQLLTVYQSLKFSHFEGAARVDVPRPENWNEIVLRLSEFQKSIELKQKAVFEQAQESISEP